MRQEIPECRFMFPFLCFFFGGDDFYDAHILIFLFNSICKLYDYAIIVICGDSLNTCDMQYGFKKKHSTTLCTVVLKELVQHYREGNCDVYCCLLDASKAFDRIHNGVHELFALHFSTKMPVKILRLIIDSYLERLY